MNEIIIRFLAVNGPSLIYSVSKELASRAETKIHYPTIHRRMHDLLQRGYIERAGSRKTKAGAFANLYATTLRGDFAALAGKSQPSADGKATEMSPHELRKLIAAASQRNGSPFMLLNFMLEDQYDVTNVIEKEVVDGLIKGIRSGYLNLDALDDGIICSQFASVLASTTTKSLSDSSANSSKSHGNFGRVLMSVIERTIDLSRKGSKGTNEIGARHLQPDNNSVAEDVLRSSPKLNLALKPISSEWCNELKVFLRLGSVLHD